jgi:hypothetical protein
VNIVPTRLQEQLNRVDRTPSLAIGIFAGLTALWSIYRLFWLIYSATVLSGVGVPTASLAFPFVLWIVIGAGAAVVSIAFLVATRSRPDIHLHKAGSLEINGLVLWSGPRGGSNIRPVRS